jgi:ribonucleotide monophosphatase NagD (HAD superfamily)
MLCLNPDFEVVKITGEQFPCAGVLALDFEKLGGKVTYFGKPHGDIYDQCIQWLAPIPKSRLLAVGDGMATDIAGAVRYGVHSVLVKGGILQKSRDSLESLCEKHQAKPDFIIPAFTW